MRNTGTEPAAGGRKEDTVSIGTCHTNAVYIIDRGPFPSTLYPQFPPILHRRHTPTTTQTYLGGIIFRIQLGFSIYETVESTGRVCTILGQLFDRGVSA